MKKLTIFIEQLVGAKEIQLFRTSKRKRRTCETNKYRMYARRKEIDFLKLFSLDLAAEETNVSLLQILLRFLKNASTR